MKFVDEALIFVEAGKGGNGCVSFRREKYIPRGGPDGGNGGRGGSIHITAAADLNTLVDYRYKRRYKAANGEQGRGRECNGRKGEDLTLTVPVGTTIIDEQTREVIADLTKTGQTTRVAQGGHNGIGNTCFKSSTNRAPRTATTGQPGEIRQLKLELKVIADVGLLGLPNAGKSTFIRSVTHARPKVADYPFTTLIPNLGVVSIEPHRSFVVADIPGLIAGASEGAGLGIRFLKHLTRCRILLHLVDVCPPDGSDPLAAAQAIIDEITAFSPVLASRDRWLVLNKMDMIPQAEREALCQRITQGLHWQGPVHCISSLNHMGTRRLCQQVMQAIEERNRLESENEALQQDEMRVRQQLESEARNRIAELKEKQRAQRCAPAKQPLLDSDSHDDTEVFYAS